ncbi:transposase [[Clostridium] ultunense Esp]|uniref:Transposase n=1 Tax=[Clostridium] ultunense Esp TaxID=1288971 RepID=M1ZCH4_9FIRM|nr:ISNCY family transposase [Schnuerera ultunensis]CCQ95553.1 transposase [[Clostridium] ultunense Esp]SHD76094.1 transposase [[Clostridium] ultunense Esp]
MTIRKVDLNMTEQEKYEIIKKLVETNGNKKRAALKIGCTQRHINRLIQRYKKEGKSAFIHGNHGRKPAHTIEKEKKELIVDFYRTKYYGANFEHFTELLEKYEDVKVSPSVVRSVLMNEQIISPMAHRSTKKKLKKQLKAQKEAASSKKEIEQLQNKILEIEDAHPRRPRCANFGEMIQMDASEHLWFGDKKTQLHIAVDDSTGAIVGAYFDLQETLNGYYNVLSQILKSHGIPYMFFTDRRTVFEYNKKKSPSIEEDTFTQFGYACKQLGIEIETSSIPQAKGRVERIFRTLQSRLIIELRLNGITTIEQANIFLNSYIKEYNDAFALPVNNIKSVFEKQPDDEKINLTLAVLSSRKIDNGHCIRYENKYFKLLDTYGYPVYYYKGTSGMVIKSFNKELYFCVEEKVYVLEEIPTHERKSRNFDFDTPVEKPKKKYIPPMSHPWKQASFEKYMNKQAHRKEKTA